MPKQITQEANETVTELRQFSGPNAGYVLEQYERFLRDPDSVTEEWRQWFASLQTSPESVVQPAAAPASGDIDRILRVRFLVDEIRRKGHEAATVDPLGFRLVRHEVADPQAYGLSEEDLRSVPARLASPFDAAAEGDAAQLVDRLRRAYCGQTGYQFDHISSDEEHAWLFRAVESATYAADDTEDCKKDLLSRLTEVEAFEKFLHRSFPGQKWFSLEGNDTLVPMLDEVNRQAAFASMDHVVVGMAHRGRLNVLAHVFGQPYEAILADFGEGSYSSETMAEDAASGWMSDVKYHAGARRELDNGGSGELTLILLPNPSHLELVDPVVAGAARAYEDESSDGEGDAAMAVLCHGDSAFAGQGVVAETLNMSRLPGYTSGGTIHIVVNNQIGFTTEPHESYSTMYATDYARGYDIPVIHVNADDVQACIAASRLAFAYRQRYHKDIVIDHVGYRRYGHNEGDEPSFTQPRMYEKIGGHPSPRALLAQKVAGEGILSDEEADQLFR
ncbi:MAG: thiamine pyrophosphate-dependent enzyme, partial [Chloroflexota bacterium]